ncbi:MAG TPA: hypothetical protein DCF63_11675 [Planctomycetaceae bacterium]|nr:hypothetical protein [Planctomycetaceae bacterium]
MAVPALILILCEVLKRAAGVKLDEAPARILINIAGIWAFGLMIATVLLKLAVAVFRPVEG